MVIQHNMAAANTNRMLGITTSNLAKSTEKLSSGYKINRAGDDAAGLTISEKMRAQVRGLEKASQNAQDGISMIQTAEGALNETTSILQRMRELTVQAANDTNTDEDRTAIAAEMEQLAEEITRISDTTEFNKQTLLTGKKDVSLQVGANKGHTMKFTISDDALNADKLGVEGLTVDSNANANASLAAVDDAIATISATRSNLGAVQNRLEHTIANLDNINENVTAAESRIRDVDMAKEMVKYSKENILQQAAQSMLSQANSQTQGVLSLLR